MTIRKATEKDFESIIQLIKKFSVFIKTPEKVSITLDQMLKDKNYFNCLVADVDGKIVGFATYFLAYYSWNGKSLYLDDLYVIEAFRGRGIGKDLFDTIITIARNENCKKLRWQVSKWNSNAIAFYKSYGAMIDDVEINCDLILS